MEEAVSGWPQTLNHRVSGITIGSLRPVAFLKTGI
jgi:hypothetical protein